MTEIFNLVGRVIGFLIYFKVSPSKLVVVGGQGPDGLKSQTRVYDFQSQVDEVSFLCHYLKFTVKLNLHLVDDRYGRS